MAWFRMESSASVRTRTVHVVAGVSVSVRRAGPRRVDRLAAELATYRTAAERLDLVAALDRHSDEDAAEIRRLLVDRPPARKAYAGLPG